VQDRWTLTLLPRQVRRVLAGELSPQEYCDWLLGALTARDGRPRPLPARAEEHVRGETRPLASAAAVGAGVGAGAGAGDLAEEEVGEEDRGVLPRVLAAGGLAPVVSSFVRSMESAHHATALAVFAALLPHARRACAGGAGALPKTVADGLREVWPPLPARVPAPPRDFWAIDEPVAVGDGRLIYCSFRCSFHFHSFFIYFPFIYFTVPVSQVVDCLKFLESVNIGALQRRAASCLRGLLAALALPPAELQKPYYLSAGSLSLFTVPPRAARAPPARRRGSERTVSPRRVESLQLQKRHSARTREVSLTAGARRQVRGWFEMVTAQYDTLARKHGAISAAPPTAALLKGTPRAPAPGPRL
jgi:hypothetical protein